MEDSDQDIVSQVKEIIASDVRPYIEMDGGGIEFVRYEDHVVYVRLFGACGTCPSSALTLKGGVERTICLRIPDVRAVEMDGLPSLGETGMSTPTFQL